MVLLTSQDQEELVWLQDFTAILSPGGIVKEQIDQTIAFLKALKPENNDFNAVVEHPANESQDVETVPRTEKKQVRFANEDLASRRSKKSGAKKIMLDYGLTLNAELSVPTDMTWSELKADIEENFKALKGEEIEVLYLSNFGTYVYHFDMVLISDDALHSGDVVTIHFKRTQTQGAHEDRVDAAFVNKDLKVNRIANSGVTVRSRFQYLALSVHSLMLDLDFFPIVDVVEIPDLMQRPWRRLPRNMFVSENWDRTPGTIRMLYKHGFDQATSRVSLLMVAVGSALVGTLSICDGSNKDAGCEFTQIELQVDRYVRECAPGVFELLDADELFSKIRNHVYEIVPVHFIAVRNAAPLAVFAGPTVKPEPSEPAESAVRQLYVPTTGIAHTRRITARPGPPRFRSRLAHTIAPSEPKAAGEEEEPLQEPPLRQYSHAALQAAFEDEEADAGSYEMLFDDSDSDF